MMEKRNDAETPRSTVPAVPELPGTPAGIAGAPGSPGALAKAGAAGDADELDAIIEEAAGLRPPVDGFGAVGRA